MATLCTYCGTALPREDARYCTNCGMLVPSHPFSPKAASSPVSQVPVAPVQPESTVRKQVELQSRPSSPSHPGHYSTQEEPPVWMNQLDNATLVRPFTPFPAIPQTENTPPAKELHVKVWDQARQEQVEQKRQEKRERVVEDDVIDLPTRPLMTGSPNLTNSSGTAPKPSTLSTPPTQSTESQRHDVEYLDTVPLETPKRTNPSSLPPEGFAEQPLARQQIWSQDEQRQQHLFSQPASTAQRNPTSQPGIPYASVAQPDSKARHNPASQPGFQQPSHADTSTAQEYEQASALSEMKSTRRKSRLPLVVAIVLLLLLAIGGVITWIIQAQLFAVPAITQPQETFTSTQLGFSLSYPNGWTTITNTVKGSVLFSDSSQTDQVNILEQSSATSTTNQALQQEVSQLKMTNQQKGLSPMSFAGTTWLQARGSVFVRGATYTGLVLVSSHNNKLFTFVQLAPQTTFAQEDQLVFASMRSTFQFLA